MMPVATLGVLNTESLCERVLSCVKLVVYDLHVSLKAEEIRMLVMLVGLTNLERREHRKLKVYNCDGFGASRDGGPCPR